MKAIIQNNKGVKLKHYRTKKRCTSCKELIHYQATKCAHCGEYQTTRKIITSGLPILAGFILTSLSIITALPIKNLIEKQQPIIQIAILNSNSHDMTFMVTNVGNQPAGVASVEIDANFTNGDYSTHYLQVGIDKGLIEPNKAYIIKAENGSPIPWTMPPDIIQNLPVKIKQSLGNACKLSINYVRVDGRAESASLPFSCIPIG
ncbi:hypothetical protein [Chromobacterium sinusclupearum]|uniref:hypothetical protein n=1 Tax=Chromobacterium sinusclupearum TaxID=2077146 RepID=UPI0011AFC745|nr:hypothetical protein [Chromobacterium sinusclupearum]